MTNGDVSDVRRDPHECARWLTASASAAPAAVTVAHHGPAATIFDVRFAAPTSYHLPGYPAEHARLTVRADGKVLAVPVDGDGREWLHRYPRLTVSEILARPRTHPVPWEHLIGALCLENPDDPPHLRWHWSNGLDAYLYIVQRHLWFEEYWRREGEWPVEDTPHGRRPDGRPYPIVTPALRSA